MSLPLPPTADPVPGAEVVGPGRPPKEAGPNHANPELTCDLIDEKASPMNKSSALSPEVAHRFQYWQTRTILATMTGYALFYFVRKNFSLAMPGMEVELGITKTSLGLFLTLNGLIYGLSRFCHGLLADRLNARYFMATGLALCALANFVFGFGPNVSSFFTGQTSGAQFTSF